MASHESAVKAHRQNLVKREANRQYRTRLRGALRAIRVAIDSGDPAKVKDALRDTISLVDKMADSRRIPGAVEALFRTDLDLKSSGGDPRVLLERLVVELCGPPSPKGFGGQNLR